MADSPKADLWKAVKNPHTRPWLAVVGEVPATLLAHAAWGSSPLAAVGMTVASGALTVGTWFASEGTKTPRRIHATISTAAGTSYLTVASFTDPFGATQLSWLAMGGSVLAATWNIRKAMRVNVDSKKDGSAETGVLVKAIGNAKVSLRGKPKVEPNKVTAPLQLSAGHVTSDDLSNRVKHIAGELGVSPNSIRIVPDPDRADQATLVVVPKDELKTSTIWPGPSNPGASITEAIHIGVYEDGEVTALWFPFDERTKRNGTHFLAAGMNGSAKSTGISVAMTDALTRRDVIVWAVDPSKGMQTFAAFLPYMDWVEMTEAGGNEMIDALSQVITARADHLGRHGFKNWTPDAFDQLGMPYMIVWIEEAAKFFRNGTEMEGLVMEARSAGISVIISLQRPSATSMPTDVREQLGGVLCFGVKGATTADMALPDDVRDAGARPEAWENRKPGYAYLVAPGVDEDRYATPLRTYLIDDDQISGTLAVTTRAQADPVTAAAAGDAYANRTTYGADTALTSTDTPRQETVVMTNDQNKAAEQALLEKQVDREIEAAVGVDPDDDGYVPAVDAEQEIPPAGGTWSFGQAAAEVEEKSPEAGMDALMAMLDEFRGESKEFIGPKDFGPFGKGQRIGRSRAWVSGALGDLSDAGIHLSETDQAGVYRLLYPEMADV
ncbi:plasmid transfer protein TraB [Streptomyces sp. NPDC058155]|uniref:plasmid transfer protein TraB n=1 Tax=Streptomyces sp. NPDC058155 TaxID=3346359 RepID=UPI0036E115CF